MAGGRSSLVGPNGVPQAQVGAEQSTTTEHRLGRWGSYEATTRGRQRTTAPGSSNVTVAPPSALLPARALPPCAVTIACTMESPRPVPPPARARPESGRLKRSNACGKKSGGKPGPESTPQ